MKDLKQKGGTLLPTVKGIVSSMSNHGGLALLLILNQPISGQSKPRLEQPEGHKKMVELLDAIREKTNDENIYQGDKTAREIKTRLARVSIRLTLTQTINAYYGLGYAELAIGNEDPAIDALTRAYKFLPSRPSARWPKELREKILLGLGIAYMRLAETENCCARNSADNCIIPIQGGGLHTEERGARGAIQYLNELFQTADPGSLMQLDAQWLLNIAHMTLGEYPRLVPMEYLIPESAFKSKVSFPKFTNISIDLGLDTFSLAGGVVCDDIDNDGYLDLVVSTWDEAEPIRYWHNQGDGSFTDETAGSGLEGILGGFNLLQADYNNDGHVDILALRGAWLFEKGQQPNSLLRNNGDGSFTDVTFDAGLGEVHYPTQTASWADYDLDGNVDLYVGNESTPKFAAPSQLFRNNGDGTFTDVAEEAGVQDNRFTKSVIWGDYDGDRYPDLYVSNLSQPNRLYRNNGDGTFTDVAGELGVDEPKDSFPSWFFDVNNDGAQDLFVSAYSAQIGYLAAAYLGKPVKDEHIPKLYLNRGNGQFEDAGKTWGLDQPTSPMGSNFGDLDGDGYVDFYLGTGDPNYKNIMPNVMYRNVSGKGFVDVTMVAGFGHLQKGHGVAFADLDHDGDQDVFEQLGGAYLGDKFSDALFENPGFGNRWIAIRLVGTDSNRSAIGSRIRVEIEENGKARSIFRWVNSGGSFGANPLRQHIGLGQASAINLIEIFWPKSGVIQTLTDVPMNILIRVTENKPEWETIAVKAFKLSGQKANL